MSFLYVPFWRTGGWDDIQYRTQLYFAPLSQGPVRLGLFLFENGLLYSCVSALSSKPNRSRYISGGVNVPDINNVQ